MINNLIFGKSAVSTITTLRMKIAHLIMPKDMRVFMELILDRLNRQYEALDDKKKDKISTLIISFDFRE
jgi:hypothetical protein